MAEELSLNPGTVRNWEPGHTEPALRHWRKVTERLEVIPFEVGDTLSERIRAYRKLKGLTQKQLADRLGMDESTLRDWERG